MKFDMSKELMIKFLPKEILSELYYYFSGFGELSRSSSHLITLVCCLTLLSATNEAKHDGSHDLNRANFGVYLKNIQSGLKLQTAEWYNVFALKLPSVANISTAPPYIACRSKKEILSEESDSRRLDLVFQILERGERNVTHCGDHEEFTLRLHEIYQTFKTEKKNMLGRIYDLFPDTMPDPGARKRRGFLDIIGHGLHVIAGKKNKHRIIRKSILRICKIKFSKYKLKSRS